AARGRLTGVEHGGGNRAAKRESFIHFEIAREAEPRVLAAIERKLLRTLRDVRAAVADWPAMLRKLRAAAAELDGNTVSDPSDIAEARAFLAWLAEDHFTLLGYREYQLIPGEHADRLELRPGTGLGLLRGDKSADGTIELTGRVREEQGQCQPVVLHTQSRCT